MMGWTESMWGGLNEFYVQDVHAKMTKYARHANEEHDLILGGFVVYDA